MISDPRQYTVNYPKSNIVINQAMEFIKKLVSEVELDATIANLLRRENDALINVALNLAPDTEVSQLVWESLNRAINLDDAEIRANIFAIPLILVAGSKNKAKLKGQLDVEALNNFFNAEGLFNPACDCFISGKLIDPQDVAMIKPSQLYYWVRNLQKSKLWLPIELKGREIEVLNEGVFLRFLIGVTLDDKAGSGLNLNKVNDNLMKLMQLVHNELKTDGVTLFPIPFAPVPLSCAFATGMLYRTEVAIQVALSNMVRKIREERLTPKAIISTEAEAIKVTIKALEQPDLSEISLWNMNRFDDFKAIMQIITNLLHDIGVEWEYVNTTN